MAPATKRLCRLGAAVIVSAIALMVTEAVRSLSQSSPDDPWSPHRKGF